MENDNSLKQFSYVAVGNIIGTALQAGFYFIFAALLDPEDYGLISYAIALSGTFSVLSRLGLPFTAVVYQAKGNHTISNQANILTIITTSAASIILIPFNMDAALLCFALSLFVINLQSLLGEKKYKKYFVMYMIKSISIITAPILLYFVVGIPGILLGMSIGNLLAGTNFIKSLKLKVNSFKEIKENYKVVAHNFMIDASSGLSRSVDKLLIVPLYGLASVAVYQFNIQIMLVATILPAALYSFLLPEESGGRTHKKINYLVISVSILFAIVVIIVSPYVIQQLFPKFYDGITSLQIMILSLIPISITSVLNAKMQAVESTKAGFAAIIKIISLLGLIAILGGPYGLIGLSVAVVVSASLETTVLSILYYKLKH